MVTVATKFIFLFILCALVSIPVSAETLELSSPGVKIYSDVNNSWDYSARYELSNMKETEGSTSYSISWDPEGNSGGNGHDSYFREYPTPLAMTINFDVNPCLKTIIAKSLLTVDESFIEGTGFHLMNGANSIGYGSFFMWADTDNKLLYLYEFNQLDTLSGTHTYDIVYGDNSIFNNLPAYHQIASTYSPESVDAYRGYVTPSGDGVYLSSTHYTRADKRHPWTGGWTSSYISDEMATTNTITNELISINDILYYYNTNSYIGYTEVVNQDGTFRLGLTHNLSSSNTESSNDYYIFDAYSSSNKLYNSQRLSGIKFDLYVDPTDNNPLWSYVLDWGGLERGPTGYYANTFVDWDADDYTIGDTGSISYMIDNYDSSTYDYSIDIYKAGIIQTYLQCNSGSGVIDYAFSDITANTSYSAKLTKYVKGSMIPLILDQDDCMVYLDFVPGACRIEFDKEVYGPNDLVNISYYNCPDGSHIIFRSDTSPWYDSKTYVSISGDGFVTYQLSGAPAGIGYYAKVCTPGNIIIASDTMQIEGTVVGYCQVHGGIYDSQDYHPLIGTVFIDSYSDVVAYDEYGAYSIIVPWGTYDISAVVSSYLSYNASNVVISGSDYNLNMFLSVNDTTTHVFRGSVTDVDTYAAVDGVLVHVYNNTFDEYDITSQSGVWVVNGLTSGSTYTLHATKDDYHPYTYSFTYDPGDFYHNFMMSPVVIDEDDTEDDVLEDDVLEDDETMTEYFDGKFREFAPTAWGVFVLSIVLWLMSILSSFGGSNKRR